MMFGETSQIWRLRRGSPLTRLILLHQHLSTAGLPTRLNNSILTCSFNLRGSAMSARIAKLLIFAVVANCDRFILRIVVA